MANALIQEEQFSRKQLELYINTELAEQNVFACRTPEDKALPSYEQVKHQLPRPIWHGHDDVINCYDKAWQIAFGNLGQPTKQNGFVSNYIDTAFNGHLFMWDSAFISLFGKYARRSFDFVKTLDNFYAKQLKDGFMGREINLETGEDRYHRFDPVSTGPNIFPWAELENYHCFGDQQRLQEAFPVMLAYHRWLRLYRTWPDGSYWSNGWACGMDNQLRVEREEYDFSFHGHMAWVDTTLQQCFSARCLLEIAEITGSELDVADLQSEAERLEQMVNQQMWHPEHEFYVDRKHDGQLSNVLSIGAFWALIAGIAPEEKRNALLRHLNDERHFNRPHRVPSLSYSCDHYEPNGDYWRGGVWAPTNYMVLRGLDRHQEHNLAYDIARSHVEHVTEVFSQTGTLWENYAPESATRGEPSKPDFVGWTGISAITIFIEYVLGIRLDVPNRRITWHVNLLEEHGIERLDMGEYGQVSLRCQPRSSSAEKPVLTVESEQPITVSVRYDNDQHNFDIKH